MKRTTASLTASLLLSFLVGCHAEVPPAPAPEPKATTSQPATNDNPDPNNQDCAAIKDPAQAENCRMWKGIAADKKKHNSNPAVQHSPGSIQQP